MRLTFADLEPHRIERPLRPERLRRIGLVAIGRAFDVDIALANLRFYRPIAVLRPTQSSATHLSQIRRSFLLHQAPLDDIWKG